MSRIPILGRKALTCEVSNVSEVKIGLEVHCQLTSLKTKLFCHCSSDYRGKPPNTLTCPTCLGIPGAMPAVNRRAVDVAVMVALALKCEVSPTTWFFRKNYFYPDLDKNFQISQYDRAGGVPIAVNGQITFTANKARKKVHIGRIHLEEDPGKLFYQGTIDTSPYTLIDYNRAGIPLLEIVTEPEFQKPAEARVFLQKIRSILEHLRVSDGTLEGSMRCDANISLQGGDRVEIKNISSFKDVERALGFEVMRQRDLLKKGMKPIMETRHWDEIKRVTLGLRVKEKEQDYRYFLEPDLVPLSISKEQIEKISRQMPELPDSRRERLMKEYGLPEYDGEVLTNDRALADFFEECTKIYNRPKAVSNWLMGDVLQCLYSLEVDIAESKITPQHLVEMLTLIDNGEISMKIAKKVLWDIVKTGKMPSAIVEEKGIRRITDDSMLNRFAEQVFKENPKAAEDAMTDEKAAHYLVGKMMALTQGRADPEKTNVVIKRKLEERRRH